MVHGRRFEKSRKRWTEGPGTKGRPVVSFFSRTHVQCLFFITKTNRTLCLTFINFIYTMADDDGDDGGGGSSSGNTIRFYINEREIFGEPCVVRVRRGYVD